MFVQEYVWVVTLVATMTTDKHQCLAVVHPTPTWLTSNWTPTRRQCTGAAAGPLRVVPAIARPPTTARRRWTPPPRRRSLAVQGLAQATRYAVGRTRKTRSAASVETELSGSTSTPSPASRAKRSSDETPLKASSVLTFASHLAFDYRLHYVTRS